eukprot:TRINITY_DN15922_c0_g2_i1.p1 TRINITY_DN15922_c0_g2~~TRINITY_DN15922_c0_g2_i1.p1  ORF type:complete len:284 (+),score=82.82 TRINITY_DN15922_c0_g2_i1:444-1295(+)
MSKLKEHKARLDTLLARKAKVHIVAPGTSERIVLTPNVLFHAKVPSKMQVSPLKLAVASQKLSGLAVLYVSSTCKRPSAREFDERVALKKGNCVISYKGKNRGEVFTGKYIYFSLEAGKETALVVSCSFGKVTNKKKNDEPARNKGRANFLTYKNIDAYIREIVNNAEETEACNQQAATVLKKRKEKSLQLSNRTDILLRNKESASSRITLGKRVNGGVRDKTEYKRIEEQKTQRSEAIREKAESRAAMQKFVSAYKYEIARLLVSWCVIVGCDDGEKEEGDS